MLIDAGLIFGMIMIEHRSIVVGNTAAVSAEHYCWVGSDIDGCASVE